MFAGQCRAKGATRVRIAGERSCLAAPRLGDDSRPLGAERFRSDSK